MERIHQQISENPTEEPISERKEEDEDEDGWFLDMSRIYESNWTPPTYGIFLKKEILKSYGRYQIGIYPPRISTSDIDDMVTNHSLFCTCFARVPYKRRTAL